MKISLQSMIFFPVIFCQVTNVEFVEYFYLLKNGYVVTSIGVATEELFLFLETSGSRNCMKFLSLCSF